MEINEKNKLQEYIKRADLSSKNKEFAALEKRRCAMDPLYFAENYVFTLDSHDKDNPYKLFPVYPYTRYIHKHWWNPFLIIPKSRQIMISWTYCVMKLHSLLFREGYLGAILSKRKEDADSMIIDRIQVMYDHLLPMFKKDNVRFYRGGAGKNCKVINHTRNSQIIAYPSGPDKVRLQTFTDIDMDEAAFIDNCAATVEACLPTIKGGGTIRMVSTPNMGSDFEYQIALALEELFETTKDYDRWKEWETLLDFANDHPETFTLPQKGIVHHHSEQHDIDVIWVHYSSNPEKATTEWLEETRKGYDKNSWRREMEISFLAKSGIRVFEGYPESDDIVEPFEIPDDWIKCRAIDYGFSSPTACLWTAVNPVTLEFYVYREHYEPNLSIPDHKRKILRASMPDRIPGYDDLNYAYQYQIIDPQASQVTQTVGNNMVSIQHLFMMDQTEIIDGETMNASILCMLGDKKPVVGISIINDMFQRDKLKIFSTLKNLIMELETYIDPKNQLDEGRKPKYKGVADHLIDCLIYTVLKFPKTPAIAPKQKKIKNFIERIMEMKQSGGDEFMGSEF